MERDAAFVLGLLLCGSFLSLRRSASGGVEPGSAIAIDRGHPADGSCGWIVCHPVGVCGRDAPILALRRIVPFAIGCDLPARPVWASAPFAGQRSSRAPA